MTGIDYVDQRFYASTYGRFLTADPYAASAKGANNPGNPGTWNRYSYVGDDPVNGRDPRGLYIEELSDEEGTTLWDDGSVPCGPDLWTGQYNCGGFFYSGYLPTAAQQGAGGGGASYSFALAASAANGELTDIAGLFQSDVSPLCESDLQALKVTNQQVVSAAQNASVQNGFATLTNYAQDVYANNPAAMAANLAIYGNETMLQYFALHPGTAAVAQSPGNTIWLAAGLFNGMGQIQQEATLLHELLHNITGNVDSVLQEALGLPTTQLSENIGNKLELDCFGAQ